VKALLRAKWRMAVAARGPEVTLVSLVGLGFSVIVFVAALGLFRLLTGVDPLVASRALASFLASITALAAVLALGTAFISLYASSDLTILLSWPLSARQVITVKLAEVVATEAAAVAILAVPIMAAYGVASGAPLFYYASLPLSFAVLHLLPTGLAMLLNVAAMRVVPAHRAREVGLAAGVILGALAYGLTQLVLIKGGAAIGTALAGSVMASDYLPTSWLAAGLRAAADGSPAGLAAGLGSCAGAGVLVLGAALAAAPRFLVSGWTATARRSSRRRRGREDTSRPGVTGESRFRVVLGLARKEAFVVLRDPAEWAQVAYMLVMVVVLLGSRHLAGEGLAHTGRMPAGLVYALSLGAAALLGSSVALGSAGREGPGRWILLSAPLRPEDLLLSKVVGTTYLMGPLVVVACLAVGGPLGRLPGMELAIVSLAALAAVPGSVAIAVAAGSEHPNFSATDPRRRARTSAGVSNFFLQLLFLGGTSLVFHLGQRVTALLAGGNHGVLPSLLAGVLAPAGVAAASWLSVRTAVRAGSSSVSGWE